MNDVVSFELKCENIHYLTKYLQKSFRTFVKISNKKGFCHVRGLKIPMPNGLDWNF